MIEMIFIKFCAIHRSPKKRGNDTEFHPGGLPANKAVHSGQWESSEQYQPAAGGRELNYPVQWHNKRVKRQGTIVVMRGLDFTSCLSLAVDPANGTFDLHPLCQAQSGEQGPAHCATEEEKKVWSGVCFCMSEWDVKSKSLVGMQCMLQSS